MGLYTFIFSIPLSIRCVSNIYETVNTSIYDDEEELPCQDDDIIFQHLSLFIYFFSSQCAPLYLKVFDIFVFCNFFLLLYSFIF